MFNYRSLSLSLCALSASTVAIVACSGAASQSTAADTAGQSQALGTDAGVPKGPRPHGPHGPPPAAFDACASKGAGDTCSVKLGDRDIAGICTAPPSGASDPRISCLPKDMPPPGPGSDGQGPAGRPPRAPPAEALTACDGKASDATCSVKVGDRSIDGSCRLPPTDSGETRLVCVPARGPGGPGGPGGPR